MSKEIWYRERYWRRISCFLINICGKYKILKETELISARRIKKTGNESMHNKILKNEEDALASIDDVQKIFKGVFI